MITSLATRGLQGNTFSLFIVINYWTTLPPTYEKSSAKFVISLKRKVHMTNSMLVLHKD
uniref:Uncharacterized protein n=1 Tax=Rhizophora mucronata TaxID=61149 RepID=A0A2P2IL24_RHIMU